MDHLQNFFWGGIIHRQEEEKKEEPTGKSVLLQIFHFSSKNNSKEKQLKYLISKWQVQGFFMMQKSVRPQNCYYLMYEKGEVRNFYLLTLEIRFRENRSAFYATKKEPLTRCVVLLQPPNMAPTFLKWVLNMF